MTPFVQSNNIQNIIKAEVIVSVSIYRAESEMTLDDAGCSFPLNLYENVLWLVVDLGHVLRIGRKLENGRLPVGFRRLLEEMFL